MAGSLPGGRSAIEPTTVLTTGVLRLCTCVLCAENFAVVSMSLPVAAASSSSPLSLAADVIVVLIMQASDLPSLLALARSCSRFMRLADTPIALRNAVLFFHSVPAAVDFHGPLQHVSQFGFRIELGSDDSPLTSEAFAPFRTSGSRDWIVW